MENIAMSPQIAAVDFLVKEFCDCFCTVFEQTTGEPYALRKSELAEPADNAERLGYVLEFSGKVAGAVFVEVDSHSAAILATRLLGTPIDDSVSFLPEHEDALFEIVSQTAGLMANSLRTRFGEAELHVERKQDKSASSPLAFTLQPADGADPVSIRLIPEQALVDSILATLAGSSSPSPHQPVPPASSRSCSENHNLQLVMDVELDLTLRFGQRILMLSEVADLTTGSVVELDRVVDEPVELLLGERVIARGEVVIVDGNYGLRITELAAIDHSSLLSA
jgi:flagellar motor switch protein FliN/FliY